MDDVAKATTMSNSPQSAVPEPIATETGTSRTPEPSPALRAKRRRTLRPYFSAKLSEMAKRSWVLALTGLLVFATLGLRAQTDRTKQPKAQKVDERGWVMFDDQVGSALNIPADKLQQLRDVDGSYQRDYMDLGNDPRTAASYSVLNDRRNADIKRILGPAEFARWQKLYDRPPVTVPAH